MIENIVVKQTYLWFHIAIYYWQTSCLVLLIGPNMTNDYIVNLVVMGQSMCYPNGRHTIVYSRSGVAEVNSGRIASLECKIIACLWFLT